ncbi:MAG: DUF6111 family protein [Pseudomonadota bacterium]
MSRQFLFALLLIAPTVIYLAFAFWQRRRAIQAGSEQPPPVLQGTPWFWLILSGFVLFAAGLILLAVFGGSPPGSVYVPPRMEDGVVVPGHFVPEEQ